MTDYSQYGEQAAILASFADDLEPSRRRFLDIGAWHPIDKSNTRALVELGWSGVMIEPSPGPMRNLLAEYGKNEKIVLVQAAMHTQSARMIRLEATDDAVSTASIEVHQTWRESGGYLGGLWVPTISWGDVANQFGGFDFVNIDAEGMSTLLFLDMLQKGIYPPCLCVEIDTGRDREMNQAATAHQYSLILSTAANAVYRR